MAFSIGKVYSIIFSILPPSNSILFLEIFSSSSIVDFSGKKYPPIFNAGSSSSLITIKLDTALEVTISYFSLFFLTNSSALLLTIIKLFNFSFSFTISKKSHFLLFDSKQVTSIFLLTKAIGTPGKPAPVPISSIFLALFSSSTLNKYKAFPTFMKDFLQSEHEGVEHIVTDERQ